MRLAEETLECTATDHQGLGTPAGKLFRRRLSDPTADEALGPRPDPGLRRSEAGPPLADALVPKTPAQLTLVGRSLLYCWGGSVGWCVGRIVRANVDRRYKMDGDMVNFWVHY